MSQTNRKRTHPKHLLIPINRYLGSLFHRLNGADYQQSLSEVIPFDLEFIFLQYSSWTMIRGAPAAILQFLWRLRLGISLSTPPPWRFKKRSRQAIVVFAQTRRDESALILVNTVFSTSIIRLPFHTNYSIVTPRNSQIHQRQYMPFTNRSKTFMFRKSLRLNCAPCNCLLELGLHLCSSKRYQLQWSAFNADHALQLSLPMVSQLPFRSTEFKIFAHPRIPIALVP